MENYSYFKAVPKEDNSEALFLKNQQEREDVFTASFNLAKYLKEQKIANVMFLDKSARQAYVGLKAAWEKITDSSQPLNLYFINPQDLREEDNFSYYEKEFRRVYKNINPEEPLLLYDACVHNGETLLATQKFFNYLGFRKVHLAVTSVGPDVSQAVVEQLALICLDKPAVAGCHPFGHPWYIEHDSGRILSKKVDSKTQRQRAKTEKGRIKDVFDNNL